MSMKSPADAALESLLGADPRKPAALLHAGRRHERWANRTLLGRPHVWFRHTAEGRSELVGTATGTSRLAEPQAAEGVTLTHHPWRDLRMLLNHPEFEEGKWIGYFSYDLAYRIEHHKLGDHHHAGAHGWPLMELGWCPQNLEFTPPVEGNPPAEPGAEGNCTPARSDFTRGQYEQAVRRVLEYIGAGDVFQVNLAQRLRCRYMGQPRELFARLAGVSPAWYGAYLELPGSRALLSTSPELFLELRGGIVTTRPIKGTRPVKFEIRNSKFENDPGYADLLHSEKDAAELHMIVDLMRNDLGRVCAYGSVKVVDPRKIETHPTVMHGVATIQGRLHETRDVVDLLRATLPGGSVTGVPKVRAMQIIDELEPTARGPYCGAIGWVTKEACCLNVAIRTMQMQMADGGWRMADVKDSKLFDVSFHVGGGIVADSDPAEEFEETLDKAAAMLKALNTTTDIS